MLTFTVQNIAPRHLAPSIPALLKSFRQFRRKAAIWHSRVAGYIFNLEVTYNHDSDTFHPHIHALVLAKFLPRRILCRTWSGFASQRNLYASPKNSVDVRLMHDRGNKSFSNSTIDPTHAALEISKYIIAPLKEGKLPPHALYAITQALRGQDVRHPHRYRLHGSGGDLKLPGIPRTIATYAKLAGLRALLADRTSPFWTNQQTRKEILQALEQDKFLHAIIVSQYPDLAIITRAASC
jgi:hypothetical protein